MQKYNFTLIQGDAKLYNLTFTREDVAVDITGWTITFTLSKSGSAVLTKVVVASMPLSALGGAQVSLTSDDTAALLGSHNYSIKIADLSDQVTTVIYGGMKFRKV